MDRYGTSGIDNTGDEARIATWIEKELGGTVTAVSKLRRWRPVWKIDRKLDGRSARMLVKGTRAWEAIPYSLWHEMRLNQILEAQGIPVAHTYGMLDGMEAFAMDWVEGERDPGLVQEAIEGASTMSPDRWQASLAYMDILARMHAIPVEAFAGTEVGDPHTPAAIALDHFERNYQLLEKHGGGDAMMAFFAGWLRRNAPQNRAERSFVTGDCGQFLNEGPQVSVVLDFEIGHIGDPLHDLACFRGRHPVENMGDLPALFRRYEQASGKPIDVDILAYHTVVFLAMATVGPLLALAQKHKGGDWIEALMQIGFIGRRTCDAMAEILDVSFDPISLPEPHISPYAEQAIDKLELEIGGLPESEAFADWHKLILLSLPNYLRNQSRYGRWLEDEDMRETAALIGAPVVSPVDAEEKLRAFVDAAGPEHDIALLRLFQRRTMRLCLLMAGADAPADHLLFLPVEPMVARWKAGDC